MSLAPWLVEPWTQLAARLVQGKLPHALLLAGPAGVGKRGLVHALVCAALCESRQSDGHACGECRACRLQTAGTHPDRVQIGFELRDDGKPRSEITVDQIRALSERFSLAPQFGGLQIAIIEPAEAMNSSSANALLKTLEEPSAQTIIILISDASTRLPATIRSRCQRMVIAIPARPAAHTWLESQGLSSAQANAALDASLGNPGIALAWTKGNTLAQRNICAHDLAALIKRQVTVTQVAEQWVKNQPSDCVWFAATLAQEEARALVQGREGPLGLTTMTQVPKLVAWFIEANRVRELLNTPLRAELLLMDLLLVWQTSLGKI